MRKTLRVRVDLERGCSSCPFEYDSITCRLWYEVHPDADEIPSALSWREGDPAPEWCPLWKGTVIFKFVPVPAEEAER